MKIYIDGTWNTPADRSNIVKLHEKYGGHYFNGPGTKAFFLDKIFGGAFGLGTQDIVDKAFDLYQGRTDDEPVHIFGFSRGAAAARMLAARICGDGGEVDGLLCFDTVGAFGIPVNILGIPFQTINLFHDMNVSPQVKHAFHAQALLEKRPAFVGTPMKERPGVVQKGFNGDHWYVGSSAETFKWMEKKMKVIR
jgi:pimeloyl-ACP methyl ester carboxylesterase